MGYSTALDIKRIQSLTDGIFAIAMTLLILGVKIPTDLSTIKLSKYIINHTTSDFLIYLLSFVTLGIFWIGSHYHHDLITKTDRVSSWLNIFFLMLICTIPFSAGLLNHYRDETVSIIFYSINLIIASVFNYLMLYYAAKKKYFKPHVSTEHIKDAKRRIIIPIAIYLLIIPLSFYSTTFSLVLFFIPFLLHIWPESGNVKDPSGPL